MATGYYESDRALGEYLLFHYGTREQVLPYPFGPAEALEFPIRCVTECLDPDRLPRQARGLDLGCAVGRSSFELARYCETVTGIDASEQFIAAARELQRTGEMAFYYIEEGEIGTAAKARVPSELDRGRVRFEVGDAMALRGDLRPFDVVLMANLIDRLPDPAKCLQRMSALVKSGGQLILTSPYTWLAEFTARAQWLGGYTAQGKAIRTLEALQALLAPAFDLIGRKDLPFLIREHARKYQWSVAEATVWVKRGT